MKNIKLKGKFLWWRNNLSPNQHILFRRVFEVNNVPQLAMAQISAETKYWLYVNDRLVVFEGGLFGESLPGCGYADSVDLAPFLHVGENVLTAHVQYYGNGGRNNVNCGCPGFLFQSDDLNLYSDESFLCQPHPAYYAAGEPLPAYLYGGHNIGFDSRKQTDESLYEKAVIQNGKKFGGLYERPIPLLKLFDKIRGEFSRRDENTFSMKLPYAMALSPSFSIRAEEGTVIDIRSDRYRVKGGPGDNNNSYNSHRIE